MHLQHLLPYASICALTLALPQAAPSSLAAIQSNILLAEQTIETIIADLVQSSPALIPTYRALLAGFQPLITSACAPNPPLPPANTTDEAISYLQEVQLNLEITSQAVIDSDLNVAGNQVCIILQLYAAAGSFIDPTSTPTTSTATATATATATPTATPCSYWESTCRSLPNANESYCSAMYAQCQTSCEAAWVACKQAPAANNAYCASVYAGCLGYNPFAPTSSGTA
ncbi:hypothetical protein LTR62_007868 [Meristemomyces frigidus]|uniref:Uncharacterized protein n=1 Tax=Meristemomyces frigidus TaxID=1508187 RepID=A0AAN7YD73_9PEZI|nr:hypothetical protein LTR62_007868 [Meristemomyces frigidus]